MMRKDEKAFFLRCVNEITNHGINELRKNSPRMIINEPGFPVHHKRAWYLLEKWSDKGWYDYGVSLDMGWITEEGNAIGDKLGQIQEGE